MKEELYKKIKDRIISKTAQLLKALKQMDKIDKKLLFVFDDDQFVNLLSVGDIQRAIIANKSLDTPVNEILRENTKLSSIHASIDEIREKMKEFRMECMPVLDEFGQLEEVYFWEDLFPLEQKRIERNLNIPVVIMAGGKGTRLKPLTNILPKPLIPIGEKTILENIMDRFMEAGCNDFHLSVNYKAETIKHYFSQLVENNYNISYIQEDKPLGTAGSLYLLKEKIKSTFFVSNCDILIEQDYAEIYDYHIQNKNDITIVAALKHYEIPYGTLETKDQGVLIELQEKPELTFKINSGMYILEPHVLNEIPENKQIDITDLIKIIQKQNGKVAVFPVSEKSWKDIGSWKEYNDFTNKQIND